MITPPTFFCIIKIKDVLIDLWVNSSHKTENVHKHTHGRGTPELSVWRGRFSINKLKKCLLFYTGIGNVFFNGVGGYLIQNITVIMIPFYIS